MNKVRVRNRKCETASIKLLKSTFKLKSKVAYNAKTFSLLRNPFQRT